MNYSILLTAYLGSCGLVWLVASRTDQVLNASTKQVIAQWVRRSDPRKAAGRWAIAFSTAFNRFFGDRHLSFRCFAVSAATSLVVVLLLSVVWYALIPDHVSMAWVECNTLGGCIRYASPEFNPIRPRFYPVATLILYPIVVNIFGDYLSLIETRLVVREISSTVRRSSVLLLLLVDLLATSAIAFVMISMTLFISVWIAGNPLEIIDFEMLGRQFTRGLSLFSGNQRPYQSNLGIYLYSTYATSFWVIMSLLGAGAIRAAQILNFTRSIIARTLNLDEKPMSSLACVAVAVGTLLAAPALAWTWVASRLAAQ